jgi:hypothetical protein
MTGRFAPASLLETDSREDKKVKSSCGTLRDGSRVSLTFENLSLRITKESGAGDEARTRNFQLGKLNFRSFIFNT